MKDLDRAVCLLQEGDHTCILCRDELLLTSQKRGIAPLLELLEAGELKDACVADKVIGKAAALLLLLGGAKGVYGKVMSESACRLLTEAGLQVRWDSLTDYVINRRGDGMCPMEQAVQHISDPAQAPALLKAALERLCKQNT